MRDLAAVEIRRLHRKVADADRRLSLAQLPGKVKKGSQDMEKRTVRLVIGKSKDGQEILGPPVRWQQPGAGRLKIHAAPKDGEQMVLQSPSGTVGGGSLAVWGTYDSDNAPPSKSKDETVIEFDKAKITLGKDELVVQYGDKQGFKITGEGLQMLGTFKGKDGKRPAHPVGGKDSRGDSAVDGNEHVLI